MFRKNYEKKYIYTRYRIFEQKLHNNNVTTLKCVEIFVERNPVSADNERLQCTSNNRKRRIWRSLRVSKSRHGKNVRDEMP